jgi:8-amino-7-oxononanoate synthase
MFDPLAWLDDALADLDARALRRTLTAHAGAQGARITIAGREYLNYGSNDYLGLAGDPRLGAAVCAAVQNAGWGAGASPLVTGRSELHAQLETRLAEFEGTEAALLFNTGFAANSGAIAALAGPGDAIYSDALNHASLIDGCRLSRADVHVYRHNDCEDLESQLRAASNSRRRLIVTDSLFSMDGDFAPLPELCDVVERYNCMLLVDEAHATGVFGPHARGVTELFGLDARVPIRIGTLSKALGCSGGFVAGSQTLIDWLANRARSYVFSTAPPAAQCAAALVALDIVRAKPARRERVLQSAESLRARLSAAGFSIGPSVSQIIPVILGDESRTLDMAARLREAGLWVPAIRPPTVPAGESRLRISLTAGHTDEMIGSLFDALVNA